MAYQSPAADDARIDVAALLAAIVRRLPRIALVTLALLAATFVFLLFQPRLYESTASILVEPRANAYGRPSGEQAPVAGSSNAVGVVSSQIELIKSRDNLVKVIDELDLRSLPEFNGSRSGFSPLAMFTQLFGGRAATPNSIDETVINTLHDRLSVVQERDSALISVVVRSTDPDLSARIANAVANAHVSRRSQLSIADTAETSGWLLSEIERLRSLVAGAEADVAEFKVDNDLFVGQNNTSLPDQQLTTVAGQIAAAQERKNTAQSRATLIRGMIDRGQPIEGVSDVQASVIVQQLTQEKARAQGELAQRSATLLSSHPTIRALNAQVAELDGQIRSEARRVAASLDAEAQIQADLERSLQADLARAKSTASTATRDTVTLGGLEREAKAQRDLLEAYLQRYNEASSRVEANSALPDVRVVSVAAPSITPASPKTALIMTAIAIVAIAVQIGAIAFGELMSGRALVVTPEPERSQDDLGVDAFDESELEPEQRWEEPEAVAESIEPELDAEPLDEPEFEPEYEPIVVAETTPRPELAREFILSVMSDQKPATEEVEPDYVDAEIVEPETHLEVEAIEPEPEPELEMAEPIPMPLPRAIKGQVRYADLVADLVLGRTHILLLADVNDGHSSQLMAEEVVGDALAKGLSVALIDAGTGRRTDTAGLADLASGDASFGDVVQKSADNSFAEVTWGQGKKIDKHSERPLTLVEALGDIYEVVVVLTGVVGGKSTLEYFAPLDGRVVLVTDGDMADATNARRTLKQAGLDHVEIAALHEALAA